MFEDISITGITKLEEYPEKCELKACKQNIKSMQFQIPCAKPDIESINEIKVSLCVQDYKIIKTILGKKLIVSLSAKVKIIYTALNTTQSVHSAHWDISFCDFILEEKDKRISKCIKDVDIFVGLEGVCAQNIDCRTIELSIIYIICNAVNNNCITDKYSCTTDECNCKNDNDKCERKHVKCAEKKDIRNTYYYPVEYFVDSDKNM